MEYHSTWVKRLLNPYLRKYLKVEICSIIRKDQVIGYGIRKYYEK